jgi:hypothetical protein
MVQHVMAVVRLSHDHLSGSANQDGGFSRTFPLLPQSILLVFAHHVKLVSTL